MEIEFYYGFGRHHCMIRFSLTLIGAFCLALFCAGHLPAQENGASFALVELFTSQGCSSCPSADRLLSEIAAEAGKNGTRVFVLSLHVDYWNSLGWKDPHGKREFSERQRRYAAILGESGAYTPQMVINGSEEFVGSNRDRAANAIKNALARPQAITLKIQRKRDTAPNQLLLEYEVSETPSNGLLFVAFVQDAKAAHIKAGENAGRDLAHTNVVKDLRRFPLDRAKGDISLPPSHPGQRIICFLQDTKTMKILAATALE